MISFNSVPPVGSIVHYRSPQTRRCEAAIVTKVIQLDNKHVVVSLSAFSASGGMYPATTTEGVEDDRWHWPVQSHCHPADDPGSAVGHD